ncbi:ABC transporter substrate-binding protein [Tissierella creatinophila]|uniref:Putative osmoprotectant uptake system substrate-binding protein OsmF n=1 Tax=Tissierella creatinophila DSM 6911 TaxID=1123403 RepID=A0A1U7M7J4_TISCR|nr:glycine betaine ABC transporter substrate-binding protein [Tissierella creatinophila]OLS03256.1 putative osmoprotectant uptake system substrate-binding protein OsmF precursor [Tissierella creatinophila DSM 6911]
MKRKLIIFIALVVCVVSLVGCGNTKDKNSKGEITIGSKTFTESLVLGSVMVQYLEDLGYTVNDETGLGETAIIRTALTSGEIDGYFEYTGTGLMQFMEHEPVFDAEEAYNLVSEWDKDNDITWLPYSSANNTYVMVATPELAEKYKLKNVSDLAKAYNDGNSITLVTAAESYERPDMMPRLMEVYDFNVPNEDRLNLELGLFYEAMKNGKAEVTTGFATDGIIERDGYVPLEDDKNAFAVYSIAPVFRTEVLEKYPDLEAEIAKLTDIITNESVMSLNSKVDIDKMSVEEAAKDFLVENGLIK